MVVAKWRQQRLWSIEAAALDHRIDKQRQETDKEMEKTDEPTRSALAFTGVESKDKSMSLFLRYEARMRRGYKQALVDFQTICDIENEPNETLMPRAAPADMKMGTKQIRLGQNEPVDGEGQH